MPRKGACVRVMVSNLAPKPSERPWLWPSCPSTFLRVGLSVCHWIARCRTNLALLAAIAYLLPPSPPPRGVGESCPFTLRLCNLHTAALLPPARQRISCARRSNFSQSSTHHCCSHRTAASSKRILSALRASVSVRIRVCRARCNLAFFIVEAPRRRRPAFNPGDVDC